VPEKQKGPPRCHSRPHFLVQKIPGSAIREIYRDCRGVWGSCDLVVRYNDAEDRTYPEIAHVLRRAKQLAEADTQGVMA
jgi:hypothetical protein